MIWKHFMWSRGLLFWVPAVVLILFWGSADSKRKARVRPDGEIEFTPNRRAFWAWPPLAVYMVWTTVSQLKYNHGKPMGLLLAAAFGILTVMIVLPFPETIAVTADGLKQISWLWMNKQIRWTDIVEINTGNKSRTVTIAGADGTKIVHSRQLPDRPRLLMELKENCGENLPPDFPQGPGPDV